MQNKFITLLLPAVIGFHVIAAQQMVWELVPPRETKEPTEKEKEYRSLFKDEKYYLGSGSHPSPRSGFTAWQTDPNTIWLFGGMGYSENGEWGLFSDLWQYLVNENKWTLVDGSGNKPVMASPQGTKPAPRRKATGWNTPDGKLWLMGGMQLNDTDHFDDLWEFDLGQREWSRIRGKSEFNQPGVWGEQKKESLESIPGSRSSGARWTDHDGNLWLYGGQSYNYRTSEDELYEDLWKYEPGKSRWVWSNGSSSANDHNRLPRVSPSARKAALTWMSNNVFWMYGGMGLDSLGTQTGYLSDLWFFDSAKNGWVLAQGSTKTGQNALMGAESGNARSPVPLTPGFRQNSASWTDKEGNLWLFGGQNVFSDRLISIENLLWKFEVEKRFWSFRQIPDPPEITGDIVAFGTGENVILIGGTKYNQNSHAAYPVLEIWRLVTE